MLVTNAYKTSTKVPWTIKKRLTPVELTKQEISIIK